MPPNRKFERKLEEVEEGVTHASDEQLATFGEKRHVFTEQQLAEYVAEHGISALKHIDNLVIGGMRFTSTGLIQVADITEDGLKLVGDVLYRFKGSFQWLIGDWLNHAGVYEWADVDRIAKHFRLSAGTLKNWKSTSSNVPQSLRNDRLDFMHHYLVAYLPEDKQREWLEKAAYGDEVPGNPDVRLRWSVGRLRKEMRLIRRPELTPPPLLDRANKRRMSKLWLNVERGTYNKITQDDIGLVREWLGMLEAEIRLKRQTPQK